MSSNAKKGGGSKPKPKATNGSDYSFSSSDLQQLRPSLLAWYDKHHRVLPWRRNEHSKRPKSADDGGMQPASLDLDTQTFAYRVWVSEIMCQQTQVATVIPYFEKWITRWPTVPDLAKAEVEEVNSYWAGLGYYRRARYLLDGAKHVMDKLNGTFPTTAKELLSIPGVGPYTSAAVASIAFGDKAAAVDGNVIRVVSRLRAISGDPTKLAIVHQEVASEMIDGGRPGCFNQAMMELGATVCRPLNPDCASCPISSSCKAYGEWEGYLKVGGGADIEDAPRVTRYPSKKERKEKREEGYAVCVLEVIVASSSAAASISDPPQGDGAKSKEEKKLKSGGEGKKRQSTLFELMDAAKLKKATGGGELKGEKWTLLVKRPDGGLLAGLWEFPAVALDEPMSPKSWHRAKKKKRNDSDEDDDDDDDNDDDKEEDDEEEVAKKKKSKGSSSQGQKVSSLQPLQSSRQASINSLLSSLLPGLDLSEASGKVLSRRDHGKYLHVFSHINRTSLVEKIVLLADSLDELRIDHDGKKGEKGEKREKGEDSGHGRPELRWIKSSEMASASIPTLTTKIWKQAL